MNTPENPLNNPDYRPYPIEPDEPDLDDAVEWILGYSKDADCLNADNEAKALREEKLLEER